MVIATLAECFVATSPDHTLAATEHAQSELITRGVINSRQVNNIQNVFKEAPWGFPALYGWLWSS